MVCKKMNIVDRRVVKSKEAIKKAVLELMSNKDFNQITIQEIADNANVNRRTIYLHYQDKYDLIVKLIENQINELEEMCKWTCKLDSYSGALPFFEYFEKHFLFFSTMLSNNGCPIFREKFMEYLVKNFEKKIDTTGKNEGLKEEVILQYVATAYVGVVEWWIISGMPYSPEDMAKQVAILLDRSL